MEIFVGIILFVLGLCLGSFVNMLIFRTAEGYGLKKAVFAKATTSQRPWRSRWDCFVGLAMTNKRSFCDHCGRQMNWYENVPVVSWLIQKGKTRCCNKKLPIEYPIIELGMGLLLLILNYELRIIPQGDFQMGANWEQMIVGIIVMTLLVFSFIFDLKYLILPDFSTFILIGLALILMMGGYGNPPLQSILSAIGASLFLLALNLITKGKGMGMGDVKFALFMGLWLCYPLTIVAFYIAFIGGAIVGLGLIIKGKLKRKSHIPFGPFLIIGTLVAWWWGEAIKQFLIYN